MTTPADGRPGPIGLVLETVGGTYRVRLQDEGEIEASLRGRVKHVGHSGRGGVVAGDRVLVSATDSSNDWVIEDVCPRFSELVRAGPGGRRPKVVAANLDRALTVFSASKPPFDLAAADRFLILAESCGIPPVIVLNKMDLSGGSAVEERVVGSYVPLGYRVLPTSARTGEGLDELGPLFETGISALIGPSGVGKSSILNALFPALKLRTGEVARRRGRGRHTTVGSRLIPVTPAGCVADTPGFSDVSLWGVDPPRLGDSFPEFRELSRECRFAACTHTHEPDCAVRTAVEDGRIPEHRYRTYKALLGEG